MQKLIIIRFLGGHVYRIQQYEKSIMERILFIQVLIYEFLYKFSLSRPIEKKILIKRIEKVVKHSFPSGMEWTETELEV